MSYNIRNIREISNEPLTKFTNQISKKIFKFLNDQQLDKLANKEDIYSDGQDVDSIIKYHYFESTNSFDFFTEYKSPSEPDFDKLKCWIQGNNLGNDINDISGFSNHGTLNGDPILIDGTPFDYGIHTGGTKSKAVRFNRPTSGLVNQEYIGIPDASNLQVSGITTGMSYFIRFRIHSLANQGSRERTLFEKIDDNTPNNAVIATVSSDGRLKFYLKRAGSWNRYQTATSTIATNTVYECWLTYANSGNTGHIWVNNSDKSLTDPGSDPTLHTTLTNHDLSIFRLGAGSTGGYLYGDYYDFELFKEKVASSTEIGRHFTNKWTLADIAFGSVMVSNYWATHYTVVPSFTTTSFTSTSFST